MEDESEELLRSEEEGIDHTDNWSMEVDSGDEQGEAVEESDRTSKESSADDEEDDNSAREDNDAIDIE